jgi:hypothetical protein
MQIAQQIGDQWYHSVIVPNSQGAAMPIGSALEHGSSIFVFDDRGQTLFSKAKGSGADDGLLSFTGSTVTIRFGSVIYTYDEDGHTIYAKSA